MSGKDFKGKFSPDELIAGERAVIMFDLVCMMAEKTDKTKYKKIKEEWNKKDGEYRS